MSTTSNSVGQITSPQHWLEENWHLFQIRWRGRTGKRAEIAKLRDELRHYGQLYESITGRPFKDARIFEVGYGARPLRLIMLVSMQLDASGIDLDQPTLNISADELRNVLRKNGLRRFLKTAVRSLLFDSHERAVMAALLAEEGHQLRIDPHRFRVGDVTQSELATESLDLVYSEDVFEHIPGEDIERICAKLAQALRPGGLALISPLVHTSIQGGHLVEWYGVGHDIGSRRRSAPWEHLREKRYRADCYLNEWRLDDYQRAFSRHFEIVAIQNLQPDLGRDWLDEAVRAELRDYEIEELLGSKWRFVLRKPTGTSP